MVVTYLLTPWCRVLLQKLSAAGFITALTSVRHLSLSWASPIQSLYTHPTSWGSILILSAHLRLGLPSGLLPSGFPTKTLYTPLSSLIRATCPAHAVSWSTVFMSLPVPDLKFLFHCLFLIYTYHFILPVPELHFPLHYLFLIYIIISLTVPDRQFSLHCLFLIHNCHFTLYYWSTVLISFPLPFPNPRLILYLTGQNLMNDQYLKKSWAIKLLHL